MKKMCLLKLLNQIHDFIHGQHAADGNYLFVDNESRNCQNSVSRYFAEFRDLLKISPDFQLFQSVGGILHQQYSLFCNRSKNFDVHCYHLSLLFDVVFYSMCI